MPKPKEDGRDIYDKVADYLAPVAGAAAGAALGGRLGASKKAIKRAGWDSYDASWKSPLSSQANAEGAMRAEAKFEGLKRRRLAGQIGGAGGGAVAGAELSNSKKRRK